MSLAHCSISWRTPPSSRGKRQFAYQRVGPLLVSSPPILPRRTGNDVLNTPVNSGALASLQRQRENGVWLAGLSTIVQPAASAGPVLRAIIAEGSSIGYRGGDADGPLDHQQPLVSA